MSSIDPDVVDVDASGPNLWIIWLVLGVLSTAVGVWLIFSPEAAVFTLALLLAIGLFFNGLGEMAWAGDRRRPWVGYVLGALFVISGIVVVVWPDIGLRALAIVAGIALLTVGLFQAAAAVVERDELRHWGWLAALGAITFVAGFLALVWPKITVLVLALILGIRLTVFGIVQIVVALDLRKLTR